MGNEWLKTLIEFDAASPATETALLAIDQVVNAEPRDPELIEAATSAITARFDYIIKNVPRSKTEKSDDKLIELSMQIGGAVKDAACLLAINQLKKYVENEIKRYGVDANEKEDWEQEANALIVEKLPSYNSNFKLVTYIRSALQDRFMKLKGSSGIGNTKYNLGLQNQYYKARSELIAEGRVNPSIVEIRDRINAKPYSREKSLSQLENAIKHESKCLSWDVMNVDNISIDGGGNPEDIYIQKERQEEIIRFMNTLDIPLQTICKIALEHISLYHKLVTPTEIYNDYRDRFSGTVSKRQIDINFQKFQRLFKYKFSDQSKARPNMRQFNGFVADTSHIETDEEDILSSIDSLELLDPDDDDFFN